VKWILQQGVAAIHHHEMELWRQLRDGLQAMEGVTLYCQDGDGRDRISVLPCNVDGLEASDTGTMLDVDFNVACRTGLHCTPMVHEHLGTDKLHGAVRFGIGAFNTADHVKTALEGMAEIVKMQKNRKR
jgi:selenocysteine lyase/cysteine desulfurase